MPVSSELIPNSFTRCVRCGHQSPLFKVDLLLTPKGSKTPGDGPKEQWDRTTPHLVAAGWKVQFDALGGREAICPACQAATASFVEIDPFRLDAQCPKCGNDDLAMRYCTGLTPDCPRSPGREHLHRTCLRCEFDWMQATKDDDKIQAAKLKGA